MTARVADSEGPGSEEVRERVVPLRADGHVHVHPGVDADVLLDAAWSHLLGDVAMGRGAGPTGYLLLSESRDADVFGAWAGAGRTAGGRWRFEAGEEPEVLRAECDRRWLVIVAGRQIRADDGLEVLALGTREDLPDGLAFEASVGAACRAAPLVALPWGFGKWWGARGEKVARALDGGRPPHLFAADSGCRPWALPEPRVLREARRRGEPVLSGTDPLPLPGHDRRAGTLAFEVVGGVDPGRPLASLVRAVLGGSPVRERGRRRSLAGFVADQVRLRLRREDAAGGERPGAGARGR